MDAPAEREGGGYLAALSAYVLWGFLPLYWPHLRPASVPEIIAHRVVWTSVFTLAAVAALGRGRRFLNILRSPRSTRLLVVAAIAMAANWMFFADAADRGAEVDISLGYFINPLVTVLLGFAMFRESVRHTQWAACGIAGAGVVALAVQAGHLPVTSIGLATTFALYGVVKKTAGIGALESVAVEMTLLAPFAGAFLAHVAAAGHGHLLSDGGAHLLLMLGAGPVTLAPLLLFSAATTRIPLVAVGLLQYVGPTIQFLLGVFLEHNAMSPARFAGFATIWAALALFATDGIRSARRRRAARTLAAFPSPAAPTSAIALPE